MKLIWVTLTATLLVAGSLSGVRASGDHGYFADKEFWIGEAESEVASKLHQAATSLIFADEMMYLTRKPEAARDPVIVCGNVSATREKAVRFVSNGAADGTYLDDRGKAFGARWASWCKTISAVTQASPDGVGYEAMEAVRSILKDPDSAKFGDIDERTVTKSGARIACGTVNARNGFGGYGGFKRFISGGTANTTSVEGKTAGFEKEWGTLCR